MKKTLLTFVASLIAATSFALSETVDGYVWQYSIANGIATIESGITPELTGWVVIPSQLGGCPVKRIGNGAFIDKFYNVKRITIPDGVEYIGEKAFWNNAIDRDPSKIIDIPASVNQIQGWGVFKFSGATIHWKMGTRGVEIINGYGSPWWYYYGGIILETACPNVPDNFPKDSCISVKCARAAGLNWIDAVGSSKFAGYLDNEVATSVLSVSMRANNPTIMDVNFKVKSAKDKVKVRALAYQAGIKSFANVLRPVTFTADTKMNVGDNVNPNETHTLSWQVSADVASGMSDIAFEVLAIDEEPLTLELTTIPATSLHCAITYSWNALSDDMIKNALYWYYACGESDLTLENGTLKANGVTLASGASLSNAAKAAEYVLGKMGYSVLSGDELAYVNSMTNLGLSPSGSRQYAVKYP